MKSATHIEATTLALMSVKPWRNGWLEFNTLSGLRRWLSSFHITAESIRISGGMIVVTSRASPTLAISPRLLDFSPASSSGYRHESGSLLSVFWQPPNALKILSSRSVIRSFALLDDIAVAASPTLQELRHECQLRIGDYE